ncbi:MAG: patatin-like phospholipase family protein [Rhizobiaceae bacterium]
MPDELTNDAQVVGLENVRFWGDDQPSNGRQIVRKKVDQSINARGHIWNPNRVIKANFLIITGGGPDGAFGAGLLNGMTDGGHRLDFEVVTGVSTGALIAPFAFLGPKYDDALTSVYTTVSSKDIIRNRGPLAGLGGSSLGDSKPLQKLIAKHVTLEFLDEVASEYRSGRRLFIGTTNLDAQRPVIWNMGAIAEYRNEAAVELFRKVLLASASIPALFPPVHFDVTAGEDDTSFQELHVDGGTTNNAFFLPLRVGLAPYLKKRGLRVKPTMYVIRNSSSSPLWEPVKEKTFPIAKRSISTLVKSSTTGDLYKLYTFSRLNNIGFKLISVPSDFNEKQNEAFDKEYMQKLYDIGYGLGRKGPKWESLPPGL